MSDDPNELAALTPAHFLIGSSTLSVPPPEYDLVKRGSLDQYQQWQLLVQKFWKHWRTEYLQELQRDTKIAARNNALQPGQLVILIDDLLPVTRWPLARIARLHPGKNGITRVVQLRTSRGELTRPVAKICALPPV
uniref:DUF5641 domain-containing protein n=1 Tax=Anopheles atroparvus TaxID=41427 RepID=A0AAG5DPC8_ANOAO